MKKGRVWTTVLIVMVALLSGGAGFYVGFGKGAQTMATLGAQNRVHDALAEVRRSVAALDAGDVASMQRKIVVDLRVALFALYGYGPAVPYLKCRDQERKAMESAGRHMAAYDDEPVFRNAPPLQRAMKFCVDR